MEKIFRSDSTDQFQWWVTLEPLIRLFVTQKRKIRMTPKKIQAVLLNPEIETIWMDCLAGWEDGTKEQIATVLQIVRDLRDRFIEMANDVDDPETLATSVAVRYIELKSRWIMLNTQIQFRTVRGDELDMAQVYEASLTSLLLEKFEELLDFSDVTKITSFLSQPIRPVEALPLAA